MVQQNMTLMLRISKYMVSLPEIGHMAEYTGNKHTLIQ